MDVKTVLFLRKSQKRIIIIALLKLRLVEVLGMTGSLKNLNMHWIENVIDVGERLTMLR